MSEDEEIRRSVERNGWHAIAVDESEHSPAFLYTIGLFTSWSHPEIICLGLSPKAAYSVVGSLVEGIRGGTSYTRPDVYLDVIDALPLWIRPVHASQVRKYFGYAMGYYRLLGRPDDLRALQVFWPDREGRLPNDVKCDPLVAAAQPRLELPVPP